MLFNSFSFIFLFLPVVVIVDSILLRRLPGLCVPWLVLSSIVFYGLWNIQFAPVLLGSCLFNFGIGWLMHSCSRSRVPLLGIGIAANLALLAGFKYSAFLASVVQDVFGVPLQIPALTLPLGISFFTFTQLAFLVDTARGDAEKSGLWDYLLFVTYFPHLIAGPIIHHKATIPQFRQYESRMASSENLAVGGTLFIIGLFKKVVLADSLAVIANAAFNGAAGGIALTCFEAWLGVLAYALQLYFDFSGYCDMALGISRMFGIKLPANFNSPYKARSVMEFWRRWHMTLSSFLREYVYIPLGGNRRSAGRQYVNLMTAMLIGGLWHGAGWTFILWGALHGLYLCINHFWRKVADIFPIGVLPAGLRPLISRSITFLAVLVAWVLFRASDLSTAGAYYYAMADYTSAVAWLATPGLFQDTAWPVLSDAISPLKAILEVALGLFIVWAFPNSLQILRNRNVVLHMREFEPTGLVWKPNFSWTMTIGGALAIILMWMLTAQPTEFLYYQF